MTPLLNLLWLPVRYLLVLLGGVLDLLLLGWHLAPALLLPDPESRLREARARLADPVGQRHRLGVLRPFWSSLVLDRRLVAAYPNAGTALVTRFADVVEVLARDQDFVVVYEPRLRRITGGENLFLGMADGPAYQHDQAVMRLVVRAEDIGRLVVPLINVEATDLVSAHPKRIDVPAQLTLPVAARLVKRYVGTPGLGEAELIDGSSLLYRYLFLDPTADPDLERRALAAAKQLREALDQTIAERRGQPTDGDDLLNRCLDLQRAHRLGLTDGVIRNHLLGLMVTMLPTLSQAAVQALDQLLRHPQALEGARAAARINDSDRLARYVFEALRFNPLNPVLYRRAVRDAVIASGTPRARRIPQDSLVLLSLLGAMFDPWALEQPRAFRNDRPWQHYLHWGQGLHACFGRLLSRAAVPALLRPLLARGDVQRADGADGQIDGGGGPLPVHFVVELGRR